MPNWAKHNNTTLTYRIGTWNDAGEAVFTGATAALQCMITDFSINDQSAVIDGSTLCDTETKNVAGRTSGTISFTAFIPKIAGGRTFQAANGLPIELTFKPASIVTTAELHYGVVTGVNVTGRMDQFTTEAVTVTKGIVVAEED